MPAPMLQGSSRFTRRWLSGTPILGFWGSGLLGFGVFIATRLATALGFRAWDFRAAKGRKRKGFQEF